MQTQQRSSAPGAPGAFFDVPALVAAMPPAAETMVVDIRLSDEAAASSRVFRVYRAVPPHYHHTCDEYLYVLSGRAMFTLAGQPALELGAGQMVFFKRNVVHAIAPVEEPLVFLTVDAPRRDPGDVVFVDPADGTPPRPSSRQSAPRRPARIAGPTT